MPYPCRQRGPGIFLPKSPRSQREEIAFAIFKPSSFAWPYRRDTIDGRERGQIVLFKDDPTCFESGDCGLDILNQPESLSVGTAFLPLRSEDRESGVFAAAGEKTSFSFARPVSAPTLRNPHRILNRRLGLYFASIRFRHCQITLPLFERDWQSLKLALRHNSLPKVPFATKTLPKDFSVCFGKKQTIFARKIGSCSRLSVAMRQGYLAMHARSQFRARLRSCLLHTCDELALWTSRMGKRLHSLNERQEQDEGITLYERAGIMSLARHVFDENRVARTDV